MSTRERRRRTPDLLVEKLHLGELPRERAAAVREHLAADGELERLVAVASDEGLGYELPEALRRRILAARARRASAHHMSRRTFALAVTAASLAVVALVLALPRELGDGNRAKGGGTALVIYRQLGRELGPRAYEPLADGAIAHAGDTIQLALRGVRAKRAAIYSVDGRGAISEHLPPSPVPARGELRLPNAFILDDAPSFERFFLVVGDTLDPSAIRAAIAALPDPASSPLRVPGARVLTRLLGKAAPP